MTLHLLSNPLVCFLIEQVEFFPPYIIKEMKIFVNLPQLASQLLSITGQIPKMYQNTGLQSDTNLHFSAVGKVK